jgi:putative ATP-dependent endonuclease of OLD family
MTILIDTVRIANFRGIKEVEVNLSPTTLLVGANNAGKTSFLKALHLALGADRRNLTKEDFHDDGSNTKPDSKEILIDIRIVPYNFEANKIIDEFEENWATGDFSNLIKDDGNGYQYVCFRTKGYYDIIKGYVFESLELQNWDEFNSINNNGELISSWKETKTRGKFSKKESIPLFFIDAQRDIQLDLKDRSSYLGKLTERLNLDDPQIKKIEEQLNTLNENIVNESPILEHLKTTLLELSKTVNSQGTGVEITPITKKIRDIGRNLNINFKDTDKESLPLDYHGMGTRSWASVLTLNAFISWNENEKNENKKDPFFPIIALEEPESHLHPNAQRHLFKQLKDIKGQKIISTHSPFVAAQSELTDLRHFYKDENGLRIGALEISDSDEERIKSLLKEIEEDNANIDLKRTNNPIISDLKQSIIGKINSKEVRKIRREVMNTRGELLFAKAIIFFEGETEEQALPIFAEKYFGCYPFELGFSFIGVGGKNNYAPFLTIAKFLNIPWFIFSDADGNLPNDTVKTVKNQVEKVFGKLNKNHLIIDLGNKNDFESYLVQEGYHKELNKAIDLIENKNNYLSTEYIPKLNGEKLNEKDIRNYNGEEGVKRALIDCLRAGKTKYATQIAENITSSIDKDGNFIIPTKIKELFDLINKELKIKENEL